MAKSVLPVAAILLGYWAAVHSGHAQPVAADKLNKASDCQVAPIRFIPGQKVSGPMTLKNDGGWCWSDGYASQGSNLYLSAGDVVVRDPPKHGRVTVGDLANHRIRTAYQPENGFAGQDSFTLHYRVIDTDRTYQVTVTR